MRKHEELADIDSCINKALADEMVFVLLGRDLAAPATIRFWIAERIRTGLNAATDMKILEAEQCARIMEEEREKDK